MLSQRIDGVGKVIVIEYCHYQKRIAYVKCADGHIDKYLISHNGKELMEKIE